MDVTETYIKMCDCPEIQEGKDQDGVSGTFHFGGGGSGGWCPIITRSGEWYVVLDHEAIRKCHECGNEESYIVSTESRWLPLQHQIQEMHGKSLHDLLIGFKYFCCLGSSYEYGVEGSPHYIQQEQYISQFTSMEQLWLAFYMKRCHNKVWTGEKWEESNG